MFTNCVHQGAFRTVCMYECIYCTLTCYIIKCTIRQVTSLYEEDTKTFASSMKMFFFIDMLRNTII